MTRRPRRRGEVVEEPRLHRREVVGDDLPAGVDVVVDVVAGGAGAGGVGALEELGLDLREILGDDRAAAVDVALEDVEVQRERVDAGGEAEDGEADAVAVVAAGGEVAQRPRERGDDGLAVEERGGDGVVGADAVDGDVRRGGARSAPSRRS